MGVAVADGRQESSASGFPGPVVRAQAGEGYVAPRVSLGPQVAGDQGNRFVPAEPHPLAALPPGRPKRTTDVEIDAATVDFTLKKLGHQLLLDGGWKGTDGMHRIQVIRVAGGGVVFRVEE